MRLTSAVLTLIIFSAAGAPGAAQSVDSRLQPIIDDYWELYLSANPAEATWLGKNEFNDRLPSVTPDNLEAVTDGYRALSRRVGDLDPETLSASDRVNADLLTWVLDDKIAAAELGTARIPFNTFWGFYMTALRASSNVSMQSAEDYEMYLARLRDIPRYFEENIDNMRRGSADGFVLPQIVIDGVLPTIQAQVKENETESSFFEPFKAMSDTLSEAEQDQLRGQAKMVINKSVMPAFAKVADFLSNEYQASEFIGAEQLPDGEAFYEFQIRRYTTLTNTTADEIHETGLAEVDRIREEMEAIIDELEFDGDFEAFSEILLTDPQFYAKTADELLQRVAYVAKSADYVMPSFFGKLPRQSYGVVAVPDEIAPNYTTGAYSGAPKGAKNGGTYWVNTYALDQRPLYEIPALTLHEAVPGHHHQAALALELEGVPEFRRSLAFSAFGEGWGLYSEKLGVEMGIYKTLYEHFGRLSYEMWRACRLVIDTGIHSQGWTRQQAIDYLMENTALSAANARAEIDRYISWPGQALSYKLGELKIWELRRHAEATLGDAFDLRDFHDAILSHGEMPLAMLDAVIAQHIDDALERDAH